MLHDMVGLFDRFVPKFVKRYANVSEQISAALEEFQTDVRKGSFPKVEHSFTIKDGEYEAVLAELEKK